MTLDQLIYVVELSKYQTLANTADALHISQSGLSKSISQLEEELGVKIFERDRNGTQLTPEGEELLPLAKQISNNASKFKDYASNLGIVKRKEVFTVAFANTILKPFLNEYIQMQKQNMSFRLNLIQTSSADVVDLVAHHSVDLGFAAINDYSHNDIKHLAFRPVHDGHLRLFTSAHNELKNCRQVTTTQLRQQRFVLFDDPYNENIFRQLQYLCGPLDVVLRTSDPWTIMSSIRELNAVTFARDWQTKFSVYSPLEKLPSISVENLVDDRFVLGWVYDNSKLLSPMLMDIMQKTTNKLTN
ncbi:LysR family transcriptional regulator [Lentilactobacillus sunkii]|uniref:Fhu operon transcription regulator n=1 Tax=Lentilactobacillus sunkii DSM 19904 TaxID=1423808 RepID=A0A0R1L771_9LACO|nr:LysR family transcriptional regulator [Lentilactobacillus sunkii]KRK89555.1 fhu operon transcription regulator [Lentilactobacillus sunkii DSM 19904]